MPIACLWEVFGGGGAGEEEAGGGDVEEVDEGMVVHVEYDDGWVMNTWPCRSRITADGELEKGRILKSVDAVRTYYFEISLAQHPLTFPQSLDISM